MIFDRLWVLNFLWLAPLVVFVRVVVARRRRRALEAFAEADLLPRLAPLETRGRAVVRGVLYTLAFAMLVLAAAGPRWGEHYEEVRQKGVDIIVAVDVSRSMLVEDVKPNRLARARREVADLVNVVTGDRLGLVAFAGAAFLQCPLTLDYQALEMFLGQLSPDLIPVPGTDLGDAIDIAVQGFSDESDTDRVILLLTDGEDNEGAGLGAADKAAGQGVKIFVFGMGEPQGGPVPAAEGGGFEKDEQGNLVLSRLDERSLEEIAKRTGGEYVRSTDGDLDLDRLYFEGIKERTEEATLKTGKIVVHEQRFFLFALAALLLLLLEGILRETTSGHNGVHDAAGRGAGHGRNAG
ncbi:MAG: VWA domain-containing protein [Desulfatibacillaceae bacterium]